MLVQSQSSPVSPTRWLIGPLREPGRGERQRFAKERIRAIGLTGLSIDIQGNLASP